ncbi:FAD/NAD(P)-binding oxidoreductase [Actinophytocola sp.]|uniref:NAD(P)/FAD-dependent oxidoreductase n=1 Tax=Actinophytocola sp. TaxID=1872138 RepID=UPI0025B8E606|nr:FAD/NAD(P)-binding oxidoreductase [Actinophytocola sp.]
MRVGRIVIVGGGLAGVRTAERLRRAGHDGPVTLVGAEPHAPYDRPPLSKKLLTQDDEPAEPPFLRGVDGVESLAGVRATALHTAGRSLTLDNGCSLDFGRLVIATGVRPRTLPAFDGWSGVHMLRTWADCLALRAALRAAERVTVVGGGVLGCEIAASARTLGLEVALVEMLAQPLAAVLGSEVGSVVASLHRAHGVDVHCSTRVDRLEGPGGTVERVVLADGRVLETDLVVVAAGAVPNTEWLASSGLTLADGVVCDRTGTTSAEDVFAVGDVARLPHPWADGTVRLEHWTSAGDTAALVARNLLADPADRTGLTTVPYFWTDQYRAKLQVVGLPDPTDELTVVEGSLVDGPFVATWTRAGVLTGAVTVGMPAALGRYRKLVGAPATG